MELEPIITRFLQRFPEYTSQDTAWGVCYQASDRLRRFLKRRGIEAHLLLCENCRLKEFPRIYPATLRLCPYPSCWDHFVVCADNRVVLDPTAKQFDTEHPAVRVMSLSDLQREWLYYRKVAPLKF